MIINENSIFANFINNKGKYLCDGLIINPFNKRDIKIKPKSLMTIDLFYNGTNWLDKEKNIYNHLITSHNKFKTNVIYRCYPIKKNEYLPKDIRFDKKYANSFDIINIIQNVYNYDWSKESINNSVYYQITNINIDKKYIKELEINTSVFNKKIELLKPELNKVWLDLGCGKAKLIHTIKNYNPKKYVGMDIDKKILCNHINYIDEIDWVKLNCCNLRENWFENSEWYNIQNMKFDYVILNYSIMHLFDSEEFWKCLKSVCKVDTKIMFNVVSNKIKECPFILKDAYMKYDNGFVKYLFPWSHTTEISEKFIEIKDIETTMIKYNFIIDKIITEETGLSSYYDWFFIEIK